MGQNKDFIEIFGDQHFLNLDCNERLFNLHYFSRKSISGKNLVSEIGTKMLLTNQVAGILNQLYLLHKMVKWLDFCKFIQIHQNLMLTQKYLAIHDQKMCMATLVTGIENLL